jgi:hypothetical protein
VGIGGCTDVPFCDSYLSRKGGAWARCSSGVCEGTSKVAGFRRWTSVTFYMELVAQWSGHLAREQEVWGSIFLLVMNVHRLAPQTMCEIHAFYFVSGENAVCEGRTRVTFCKSYLPCGDGAWVSVGRSKCGAWPTDESNILKVIYGLWG